MYDDLPHLPFRKNIKQWNRTAAECYQIKSNCEKCFLYKVIFQNSKNECKMKYFVQYYLDKLGKPNKKLL